MKKGVSNAESVVNLFLRMEKSEGFCNFESKMHRTQSSSSSLQPPESVLKKLDKMKISDDEEEKGDLFSQLSKGTKTVKVTKTTKKEATATRKTTKTKKAAPKKKEVEEISFDPVYSEEVEALIPNVKTIFSYYCSFGDTGNKTKLKSSTFQKLLKDAKIVK